jgi:hypothetical protein
MLDSTDLAVDSFNIVEYTGFMTMTVPKIIEGLGGSLAVARRLGFKYQSRVSNWPHIGIPRQQWPEILDMAAELKFKLTFEDLRAAEAVIMSSSEAVSSTEPQAAD